MAAFLPLLTSYLAPKSAAPSTPPTTLDKAAAVVMPLSLAPDTGRELHVS